MVNKQKLNFLKTDFIQHLQKLKGDEKPEWGVMNPQQMVEHMGESVLAATGIMNLKVMTPEEKLPAMKAFIMSEKDFKPNTKNALMGETPAPVKFANLATAIDKLQSAVTKMEMHYQGDPLKTETNPFFGGLNLEEQTQLLHKHALHHLRQFRLI